VSGPPLVDRNFGHSFSLLTIVNAQLRYERFVCPSKATSHRKWRMGTVCVALGLGSLIDFRFGRAGYVQF